MNTKELTVSNKNQPEPWKFLTFREDKIVSLVGLRLGAVCELLPLYYRENKLCPIGELAKVMLGGDYPGNRDKDSNLVAVRCKTGEGTRDISRWRWKAYPQRKIDERRTLSTKPTTIPAHPGRGANRATDKSSRY